MRVFNQGAFDLALLAVKRAGLPEATKNGSYLNKIDKNNRPRVETRGSEMEICEELLATRPWLAHYLPGVPAEIEPQTNTTLVDLWRRSRATYGKRIALESFGARLSYEELGVAADQVTAWLQAKGFGKGDRAAIMAPNVMAYPAILLGILQAGGVVVNVNPLYTPRELELQILDSSPRILFVLENFAQTVGAVADRLRLEHIVLVAPGDLLGAKGHLINFVSRHVKKAVPKANLPAPAVSPPCCIRQKAPSQSFCR